MSVFGGETWERPHDGVDRASLIEKWLRPAAAEEWAKILADLRTASALHSDDYWPKDDRWALTMHDDEGQPMKALTFGAHVKFVDGAQALTECLRRAMQGTAATILAERDRRAPGLLVIVKAPPVPFFGADLTVHARCRLGFLRNEPEVVVQQRAGAEFRADLLTETQVAAERARADAERGLL